MFSSPIGCKTIFRKLWRTTNMTKLESQILQGSFHWFCHGQWGIYYVFGKFLSGNANTHTQATELTIRTFAWVHHPPHVTIYTNRPLHLHSSDEETTTTTTKLPSLYMLSRLLLLNVGQNLSGRQRHISSITVKGVSPVVPQLIYPIAPVAHLQGFMLYMFPKSCKGNSLILGSSLPLDIEYLSSKGKSLL